MIDMDSIITRAGSVMAADLDHEVVLMSIENGNYYSLTQTSRDIWQHLAQPVSPSEICRALHGRYAAPPEVIDAETLRFLDSLLARGLIQRVDLP